MVNLAKSDDVERVSKMTPPISKRFYRMWSSLDELLLPASSLTRNTGRASHIRRAQPPTNPLNGGLFHATAATKPDCAGAGSGERHDETEQTHF